MKRKKLAFIVETFPNITETFIIHQISELKKKGFDIIIYSFKRGGLENVSNKFDKDMESNTHYLSFPKGLFRRSISAITILIRKPYLIEALNFYRYGKMALSLKLIHWADQFQDRDYDLAHCHFGPAANRYLAIKNVLNLKQKFVTTFYGYDVSRVFQESGPNVYDQLQKECSAFFVMSQNMRERLIKRGFDPDKLIINPPGVNVEEFPIKERKVNEKVEIVSVGRLVEKKGFDDLLKALAIVKDKTTKKFKCTIIGDGPEREKIHKMADQLNINSLVDFKGYMKVEDINKILYQMNFFVQPSKTDKFGNME